MKTTLTILIGASIALLLTGCSLHKGEGTDYSGHHTYSHDGDYARYDRPAPYEWHDYFDYYNGEHHGQYGVRNHHYGVHSPRLDYEY